ncbi:magnesium-translocating P-type ATPase [Sodaliphilus sp.]|uniref:magnesium-translocating P-type ATPase n=1 Tax=Sodaliphilus sp. TaxID=2815818 RepID=UPI00388F0034
MKNLFNFRKSSMTRAVYNSEYAHFASRQTLNYVYGELSSHKHGLSEREVERRKRKYGDNVVVHEQRTNPMKLFASAFINPFIGVLTILVVISFILDVVLAEPGEQDWTTIIIISTMVVFSAILRFVQELKAGRSSDALLKMVKNTCYVVRTNARNGEIPVEELVPGDIVVLSAGDMIPADMRIVKAKDFFVSQSSLTGESEGIEKRPECNTSEGSVVDLDNLVFMGSTVISGTAQGIVYATGNQTYLGSIAKSIAGHRAETAFDKGITKVSLLLIRFMLIMVPFVFMVNGFTKGDWLEAFIFAVSVAVGLTPEMLPMIVTANLAKGAVKMSKKKVIVKDLNAIQNFGAMNILCTDKTGTLTRDKVVLVKYINADGSEDSTRRILRHAFFNSYFSTGLKNLMDKAIVEHVNERGKPLDVVIGDYKKIDEIPFDFNRRRMSVVLEGKDGKRQIITKGAVEEMIRICSHCELDGKVIPMTGNMITMAMNIVHEMNSQGMRVLAVAHKSYLDKAGEFGVTDEDDMVLIGYLAFLDPPKESAGEAIRLLHEAGVEVKVLSGDNAAVVSTIAEQVGIDTTHWTVGDDFDKMSDEDKRVTVRECSIFAKLTPHQKTEIIALLQEQDNTVGFLGDGINDAAALRQSDIGISVDTAVDIAKESADIILLEKDLMVLEQGVLAGRETFGNIIKYVKMTASSNFGNMFSVLTASAFLPFLPMLSIHLLIQNLLYDISQTAIPFDKMDKEFLLKPRRWDSSDIARFMIFIGPISSIFDIATYLLMWYVFGCQSPEAQTLFQSGWFIEGLLSQTLIVHMIRTRRIPFIQSNAAWPLMLMTFAIMAIGIAIPFTSFGSYIGLMPLPLSYFPWLIAILLSYCVLTQGIKMWYIRKFGKWL